eukprot:21539-Heterococcus_DN1.PRE.3
MSIYRKLGDACCALQQASLAAALGSGHSGRRRLFVASARVDMIAGVMRRARVGQHEFYAVKALACMWQQQKLSYIMLEVCNCMHDILLHMMRKRTSSICTWYLVPVNKYTDKTSICSQRRALSYAPAIPATKCCSAYAVALPCDRCVCVCAPSRASNTVREVLHRNLDKCALLRRHYDR